MAATETPALTTTTAAAPAAVRLDDLEVTMTSTRTRSAVRPAQLQAGDVTADGSVVAAVKVESTGLVYVTWANGYRSGPFAPVNTFKLRRAR